jgi:DNA polymerase-3 subunit beta
MIIKFNVNSLRDTINQLMTVVDKKNSRPILTNCLFNIFKNKLEVVGTDLEVSAKIIIPVTADQNFSFCINTKNISDILRELPDEDATLEFNPSNYSLKLDCGKINYSLLVSNSDEFPMIKFENSSNKTKIKSKDLSELIGRTFHAISNDETRIYLNGIYFQTIDNKFRAVAIDGHRLALYDLENYNITNQNLKDGIIIPRKGIFEIKKVCEIFQNDLIEFSTDDSFINIEVNGSYFLSVRLIAREYPKYQTVIPSKTTQAFKIDRDQVLKAVKRIKVASSEKTNGIKFKLEEGKLVLNANDPTIGNATESIDVDFHGKPIEIGFNAKYLIDTLSVIEPGDTTIEFNNELSPVVLKTQKMPNFLGIIMPLKI